MKHLTIIRHAKSDWNFPEIEDIERPLNARGKKSIKLIGNFLKEKNIIPDLIISSPAFRAQKTAKGIGKILKYDITYIKTEPVIYYGSLEDIIVFLLKIDNTFKNVFLFGHEPILSSLIYTLTKKSLDKFPTGGVCRIAFNIQQWKDLKLGHCELMVFPKQLIDFV